MYISRPCFAHGLAANDPSQCSQRHKVTGYWVNQLMIGIMNVHWCHTFIAKHWFYRPPAPGNYWRYLCAVSHYLPSVSWPSYYESRGISSRCKLLLSAHSISSNNTDLLSCVPPTLTSVPMALTSAVSVTLTSFPMTLTWSLCLQGSGIEATYLPADSQLRSFRTRGIPVGAAEGAHYQLTD